MKMSKRNLKREAARLEKLAQGKPVVSKFARKGMTEEDYQRALEAHRNRNQRPNSGVKVTG